MRLFSCCYAVDCAAVRNRIGRHSSEQYCDQASPTSTGGGILPADRDASANWRMAGMLSVGGIPNRTTVCATVGPLGVGQGRYDQYPERHRCMPARSSGFALAAGTFTIAEGNYVLLNKGITLRGAGPGVTMLQRTDGARLGSYISGLEPIADDHRRSAAL